MSEQPIVDPKPNPNPPPPALTVAIPDAILALLADMDAIKARMTALEGGS